MLFDPRSIVFVAANILLLYLTLLVNTALTSLSLYLLILGPMLVLPSLFLDHRSFFITTLFTGLWVDGALPVPFGFLTLTFVTIGSLLFAFRIRFRAEHNYHPVVLSHVLNFCILLLLTLGLGTEHTGNADYWLQVFITLILSHGVLIAVAPWFFNLCRLILELLRMPTTPGTIPRA